MTLVSWAKKELQRLKFHSPKRLLPPQHTLRASSNGIVSSQVSEVVLSADLRCIKCQERVEAMISTLNDLESIVVHLVDKKVTLTRQPTNHSS